MSQPVAYLIVDGHPDLAVLAPIVRALMLHGAFDCRLVCSDKADSPDMTALLQEPALAPMRREPVWESLLHGLPGGEALPGLDVPEAARRSDIVVFFASLDPAMVDIAAMLERRTDVGSHVAGHAAAPVAARKDPARYSAFLSAGMRGQHREG